jgi:predicted enzyme related to lactoylglutathione lyase
LSKLKCCINNYYTDYRYFAPAKYPIIADTCTSLRERTTVMITLVKFVGIPTGDQDRALKFYTEKLGFEVSTDQVFDAKQRWIELRIGNSGTRVVLFTPEGHENRIGSFFNGSFACDDVSATYRQLTARGVEFEKPPEKQPWGEFAIFKDPDGNKFVLSSSS